MRPSDEKDRDSDIDLDLEDGRDEERLLRSDPGRPSSPSTQKPHRFSKLTRVISPSSIALLLGISVLWVLLGSGVISRFHQEEFQIPEEWLAAAIGVPNNLPFLNHSNLPVPDFDPFYVPPEGYEWAAPGTILRSRNTLHNQLRQAKTAVQVLYRTSGSRLEPIVTSAIILQPANPTREHLYVYAQFQDSVNTTCQMSYQYNTGSNKAIAHSWAAVALDKGWTVAIPDHEGQNASYMAGHLQGQAILDSVRAALNFVPLGLTNETKTVVYGSSGGGSAAGWSAALERKYAPELNFAGFVFGGAPSNLTAGWLKQDGHPGGGMVGALVGQFNGYPELQEAYDTILTDEGRALVDKARSSCINNKLEYKSLFQDTKYQKLGKDFFKHPLIEKVLSHSTLGLQPDETPVSPSLIVHGRDDNTVTYPPARWAAEQWCDRGAQIKFWSNVDTSHYHSWALLKPDMLAWITDRMNGKPLEPGCEFKTFYRKP